MAPKKTNGYAPEDRASSGNVSEIIAFRSQCEELPRLCPLARTRFEKTSPMYTQITAPCEIAKNAMYATNSQTRNAWLRLVKKIAETPNKHSAVPTEPISSK